MGGKKLKNKQSGLGFVFMTSFAFRSCFFCVCYFLRFQEVFRYSAIVMTVGVLFFGWLSMSIGPIAFVGSLFLFVCSLSGMLS